MEQMIRVVLCFVLLVFSIGCGNGFSTLTNKQTYKTTRLTLKKPPAGEPAYVYIPFDVPAGVKSISTVLEYDKKGGKNRLEIGVFDERFGGKHNDKSGFRGWSGSVRNGFYITQNDATFGYRQGQLNAGKWYLIIGLAALEKDEIEVKVDWIFNDIPAELTKTHETERSKLFKHEKRKAGPETTWFRGDLHSHTFHSDGRWSVKAILDSTVANNLDFVSVTDHNTFSHHAEIDELQNKYPKLLVLKGEEITTYGGHLNVWGLKRDQWVDFRVSPGTTDSAKRMAKEAHEFGGLISANHPTMDCGGCTWTYGDWGNVDAVEIWNATWDSQDEEALKIWDGLLQQGKKITAVGSTDTHQPPYEPSDYPTNLAAGSPTVFISAKALDQERLFEGIKAGGVYVAADSSKRVDFWVDKPQSPGMSEPETIGIGETAVRAKAGGTIDCGINLDGFIEGAKVRLISFVGSEKPLIEEFPVANERFELRRKLQYGGAGYIRLEVRNPDGSMAAFTNPIWFGSKS